VCKSLFRLNPFFSVLPLILLILLGVGLARTGFVKADFWDGLHKLLYWVLLPSLILSELASSQHSLGTGLRTWLILMTATLCVLPLAWLCTLLLRLPRADLGVFLQATFRGNLAFVGIPVIQFALGEKAEAVIPVALLVFAPTMVVYNVLSVVLLQAGRHPLDRRMFGRVGLEILRNPLIIATVLGLLWQLAPGENPEVIIRTLRTLGATAAPMALLAIGAAFAKFSLIPDLASVVAGLVKTAALPTMAWWISGWAGMPPDQRFIVMIFSASPTAAAAYIMAKAMGGNERLASGAVVWSTLLAVPALMIVVAVFRP